MLSSANVDQAYQIYVALPFNYADMAKALQDRNYPSLQLKTHVFEDKTHLSIGPPALNRGLRAVFGPWREA